MLTKLTLPNQLRDFDLDADNMPQLLIGVASEEARRATTSDAARKNFQVLMWKAGVADLSELVEGGRV